MPLKTNNDFTELQKMLFVAISRDFPHLPMKWNQDGRDRVLILSIQKLFDELQNEILSKYTDSWNMFWESPLADDGRAMIVAQTLGDDESFLTINEWVNDEVVYIKYLINMKTNTVDPWGWFPMSKVTK